jgi:hypothetical protein
MLTLRFWRDEIRGGVDGGDGVRGRVDGGTCEGEEGWRGPGVGGGGGGAGRLGQGRDLAGEGGMRDDLNNIVHWI